MTIHEIIHKRRSRRAYDSKPVNREILTRLVTAAHLAPSYANKQSWRWVIVDQDPALSKTREALSEGNYWALKAPALAVLVTAEKLSPTETHNRPYWAFNAGLSAMNLMLQATEEGLIAHPMAGFDPPRVKEVLGIPDEYVVLVVISLGYPGEPNELKPHHLESEKGERVRLPLEKIHAFNGWDKSLES